jgi:UDP-glucose 4-epimerase
VNGPAVVTGGAGFIGSHLVEELVRRGQRVVVIDNGSTGSPGNLDAVSGSIDVHSLDLRADDAREALAGCAMVFHLAGGTDVSGSIEEPQLDLEKNVVTTLNLLQAVREIAPEAPIVNVSSAAVYGFSPDPPWSEDALPVPVWPYAVSKLAAEHYLGAAPRLYGLRTATLRLFHVFGPRLRRQVVYDLVRKLHERPDELEVHGDGTELLDLSYVTDIVEAMILVASSAKLEGEAYNVASGREVTIDEVVGAICAELGVRPEIRHSGETRPGTPPAFRARTERLRELGYAPQVSLEQGIAKTIAWYRDLPTA